MNSPPPHILLKPIGWCAMTETIVSTVNQWKRALQLHALLDNVPYLKSGLLGEDACNHHDNGTLCLSHQGVLWAGHAFSASTDITCKESQWLHLFLYGFYKTRLYLVLGTSRLYPKAWLSMAWEAWSSFCWPDPEGCIQKAVTNLSGLKLSGWTK